ncbi:putative membrane-bound dehydrogenase domain-containing protein [Robiginitalea myxolifaciens]|uniref:Putative membrane-bound dehydrogenase domain-containing protein n=1 Tax=Robiginitalea myxolifaciens TaxID=400055 RepID=A0A1I6FQQ5_9FLAO|nr:PVC-type heme-binding CxxCH protein [Robiginitalea myxolifaciens]SFR32204.1 putative membrane-bound dehydrogenase domain-containing protein [Robiginitalea myxolifaciens]
MKARILYIVLVTGLLLFSCDEQPDPLLTPQRGQTIVFLGNNLAARMNHYGFFEAALQQHYPDSMLRLRNMGDGGNTPGFRPHSGRDSAWAFPGAAALLEDLYPNSGSKGHFESPDQWLDRLDASVILAFFGYNEVFRPDGSEALNRQELEAFIRHTLNQRYTENAPAELVLISPVAIEAREDLPQMPSADSLNKKLEAYTRMMREVAAAQQVKFLDVFHPSQSWYKDSQPLTLDGLQFNQYGAQKFAAFLAERLYGIPAASATSADLLELVREKNWFWENDFKIPNGVHVFGRRYDPFGPDNYPFELEKIRQMTANRDTAIWQAAMGNSYDLETADAATTPLPEVVSNYKPQGYGHGGGYLYGQDALDSFTLAPGYEIQLVASEADFPLLANPVQLSFDNAGRLWVATMPAYPHYKPGDPMPDDKLLILEDLNGDGRSDSVRVWADKLHLPVGFELTADGVLISQGTHLKRFRDTDGDDKADQREILLSGFDDHDTHHAIGAFSADPTGAVYMAEGVFLHTNVETRYGPVRGTHGGFYRYEPKSGYLERTAQLPIPNPWGIAFDSWGQPFFLDTSGPALRWMSPGNLKSEYGKFLPNPPDLIPDLQKVRPTAGLEFVSSDNFPEEVQGDVLLGNSIGFLGIKQHKVVEDGTGYKLEFRQDLLRSSDPNFRPVDLEFAPDGSLYVVDWHNTLIGHMQHNARDPYRDHSHGRIYRIVYTGNDLQEPATIAGADIPELLALLKSPQDRTRYRARRELRGRDPLQVGVALKAWIGKVGMESNDEHHFLEALWVSAGTGRIDPDLLRKVLKAQDHRVRAAAVRVLRYSAHQLPDAKALLLQAAADPHGRVRLEAMGAASWLGDADMQEIINAVAKSGVDEWINPGYLLLQHRLSGDRGNPPDSEGNEENTRATTIPEHLNPTDSIAYVAGREVYHREGYCATCHQADGAGLPAAGFPPLQGSEWVTGDSQRLIKLTLKGIQGPIIVNGKNYPGQVPMTAFEGLLTDMEMAAVLTYVRNAFGNKATPVDPREVRAIRAELKDRKTFYTASELE